jgi:acetoin utilization protein AcuB
MRVNEWMTRNAVTVREDDVLKVAIIALLENRIRHLPVLSDDQVVGIVSDRDLKQVLPSLDSGASSKEYQYFMVHKRIRDVMTRYPVTCTPTTDVKEVVRRFCDEKIGAMPVVEGDKLVGIITQTDMMRAFLQVLKKES